jgi:polyphosphate kinase
MDKKLLEKPENYYNREMSWLQFNYRILNEAKDKSIPLFERLNFLSITESNLSEFFMVRVASLIDLVHADVKKKDIAGLTPQGQLDLIIPETKNMIASQYSTLNRQILPAMEENGLKLVKHYEDLNEKQSKFVDKYFEKEVYPVLTPMAVDSSRPFPLISNKTLNIGALIRDKKKDVIDIATVQVPSVLPRVVEIPGEDGCREIILLEQIIEKNLNQLFLNYEIICAYPYRIMRNADLAIDEDDASDLLKEIEKQIKKRAWGEVIRLDVEAEMDKRLLKELKKQLNVNSDYVYSVNGPLDLTFLGKVRGLDGFDHLKNKKYIVRTAAEIFGSGFALEEQNVYLPRKPESQAHAVALAAAGHRRDRHWRFALCAGADTGPRHGTAGGHGALRLPHHSGGWQQYSGLPAPCRLFSLSAAAIL